MVTVGEDASLKWKKFASAPPEDNFFSLESAFHVVLLLQDPTFVLCTGTQLTNQAKNFNSVKKYAKLNKLLEIFFNVLLRFKFFIT